VPVPPLACRRRFRRPPTADAARGGSGRVDPIVTAALVAGLVAGYGIAVPVGAVAVLIVGLTARTSFRVGAAAALGVATADGLYALVAVAGGAALARFIAPAAPVLRWLAALVLVAVAVRTAVAAVREHRRESGGVVDDRAMGTPGRAFFGLLAVTLLNPTTVVYFTALVLGRQAGAATGGLAAGAFVGAAFAASASWQLVLAGGGTLVGRALTGARGRLVSALGSSVLITALAVAVVVR
jgi:arginine exporter protein ArgO